MFKKFNLFALSLLIIGQTVFGPIASVGAVGVDDEVGAVEGTENIEGLTEQGDPDVEDGEIVTGDEGDGSEEEGDFGDTGEGLVEADKENPLGNESGTLPTTFGAVDSIGNVTLAANGFDDDVLENVIHTIKKSGVNFDDPNYRPKMGDKVDLEFYFELPDKHNYGVGSTLTYSLNDPLKIAEGGGELRDGSSVKYADYIVNNGEVIITFNNNIRDNGDPSGDGLETKGEFQITAEYSSSSTDLEQSVTLPDDGQNKSVTIHFQPKNGTTIEKTVKQENDDTKKNSNYVDWTVTVNTEMKDLGSGVTFTDTLDGKQTYEGNTSNFSVKQYEIKTDGAFENEKDVTTSFTSDYPSSSDTGFSLSLKDQFAYVIQYRTIPGDTEEEDQTLGNSALFNGASDSKETTITYGKPLYKDVEKKGEEANWEIQVNNNRKTLLSDVEITDTWNSDKHELKGDITVNGLDTSDYTRQYLKDGSVTNDISEAQGFTITLNNPVSEPFTITYTTKPKDLVTNTINITNEVERSDRSDSDEDKKATAYYSQNVISKTASKPNYQAKTIDWEIVLNNAGYTMENIVLTDTFDQGNLKIKDGTFKVNGQPVDPTKLSNKDGDEKKGFVLKLDNSSEYNGPITITYTTEYDVRGIPNLDQYNNIGVLKWETDNKTYNASDADEADINTQQKEKGYKTGEYNYEDKTFDWTVGINYNFDAITNATFKDVLPSSQEVMGNVEVYKLDLSGGENGKIDGDALEDGKDYNLIIDQNKITITFPDTIQDAYRIIYQSKEKDDYYEPDGNLKTIENKALLTGENGYSADWKADAKVEHSDKLLTKDYRQQGNTAKLHWTLNLNWGQSTLNNVVIKDTVGNDDDGNPNQMIYEESFEVCEMNYSGTTSTPSQGTCHNPGDGLYDVSFDETDSTFKITFEQEIDKAYVIKYDSYFLGGKDDDLENTAILSYSSKTEDNGSDKGEAIDANFSFFGSASTSSKKGQLQITKVDEDDNAITLSGAEFELWSEENGDLIETVSTDVDGVYTFKTKVGQGKYYLKETKAPEGYSLTNSEYHPGKEIDIDESLKEITIDNTKLVQTFKVQKQDGSGNPLPGAVFELQDDQGDVVAGFEHLVSGDDGWIIADDELEPGDYKLVEIKAPASYKKLDNPVSLKIEQDQIAMKELDPIKNDINGNSVTLLKYKDDKGTLDKDTPLADATFTLYDKNDDIVEDANGDPYTDQTTDAYGELIIEGLDAGEYYFVETKAPRGYQLDKQKHEFTIVNGEAEKIEVGNKVRTPVTPPGPTCDDLTVTVKDADGENHSKAKITVKDKNGSDIITVETDDNGKFTVTPDELADGEYDLYQGDVHLGEITVDYKEDCEAEVTIYPVCTIFTLTVIDGDDHPFNKVDLTVKDGDGNIVKDADGNTTWKTDADGKIVFSKSIIKKGKYTLYDGTDLIGSFTVKDKCGATVKQVQICPVFTLTINDEDGEPNKKFEITIKDADGKVVETETGNTTWTTDGNGQIKITGQIIQGTYTVYDGTALLGTFTVEDECNATVDLETDLDTDPDDDKDTTKPDGSGNNSSGDKGDSDGSNKEKDQGNNKGNLNVSMGDGDDQDHAGQGTGKNLPKTATNTFNLMLIGLGLLVAGSIMFYVRKRKSA